MRLKPVGFCDLSGGAPGRPFCLPRMTAHNFFKVQLQQAASLATHATRVRAIHISRYVGERRNESRWRRG